MKIKLFNKTIYLFWLSKSEVEKVVKETINQALKDALSHSITQI